MNRLKKMKSVLKNDDGQGSCRGLSSGKYVEMAEKALKVDQWKKDRKEIAQHSTTEQHDDGNRGRENNTTPEQYGHAIVNHETLYTISL
ncbi:hypothetical protein T10_3204 [Trichinella papuae]|uniref:Uncharacterized protein n=1 Tax=Trichinella papuae TaxID=268474 RepID=A0A0V1M695_9BILA|nr:hypothetical protein T10_3204 [Trichinella papuae]